MQIWGEDGVVIWCAAYLCSTSGWSYRAANECRSSVFATKGVVSDICTPMQQHPPPYVNTQILWASQIRWPFRKHLATSIRRQSPPTINRKSNNYSIIFHCRLLGIYCPLEKIHFSLLSTSFHRSRLNASFSSTYELLSIHISCGIQYLTIKILFFLIACIF